MSEAVVFKSLKELDKMQFFMPSYQRGYRWTEEEVCALLDDLNEYEDNIKSGNACNSKFYCLQPLVVKKNQKENEYEVIDGQQRLTTLFLVLKYLEPFANIRGGEIPNFKLAYETRENCCKFFDEEKYKTLSDENLDFLHISNAYETISKWFESENTDGRKNDIFQVLTRDSKNAQFIWYEIAETENAYEVFKRLNSGKLSLTNSELVKALILNDEDKKNDSSFNQQDIAREWENIENHLENDEFWYFINSNPEDEKYKSTRMDYVLEVLLKSKDVKLKDNYFIFSKFNEKIKNNGWKKVWEEIKSTYRTLQIWYDDRKLYHYIGFLMNMKGEQVVGIEKLLQDYVSKDKNSFFDEIKKYCRGAIIGKESECDFAKFQYGKDNSKIHNILLAFNLATTQNQISETSRYPFKNHFEAAKTTSWSLEHIHAQNEQQKNWSPKEIEQLKSDIKAVANASVIEKNEKEKILEFAAYIDEENLKNENVYNAMMAVFMGEKIEITKNSEGKIESVFSDFEKDDTLMNLALLQADKNSAFNNETFLEKRRLLASYENAEHRTQFVPICTRNVFFKHYSPEATNPLVWDRASGKDYVKAISNVVGNFIGAETFDNFDQKTSEKISYGLKIKKNLLCP